MPLFGFLDIKTIITIIHVTGAMLGAGGALVSDGLFFTSIKDGRLSNTEIRFLKLTSTLIWLGLGVLILSGIALFLLDPVYYLASSKFLAKISIVGIIAINGLFFHFIHTPRMENARGEYLPRYGTFLRQSKPLFVSGAVSLTSWLCTLALGSIKSIPYPYTTIMLWYGIILAGAMLSAIIVERIVLKRK